MQKVLTESTSFTGNLNSESYFIPISESSLISFISDESKNVKQLKKQFDFDNATTLGKKGNLLYLKEGADMLAVYLEDCVDYEIDKYLRKL